MCGFTGWFDLYPQNKEILEKMADAIKHRGPDASGMYFHGPIAFAHRRLSIIDVSASHQPMIHDQYALVYNGELYNFQELRLELKGLGHAFKTEGDTEVLLHALIEWGEAVLPRLQGMFAFAFWDAREETLLLACDHMGVKPLYICQSEGKLLFGSELKALLEHPAVSRDIDPNAIRLYLECQYIPAPFSIFRQIRKLEPAHFLKMVKGQLEQKRYWTPSYLPKFTFDEKTAIDLLEIELKRSVKSMLVADVPVGAFVSGGIDSSLIAAFMQKEQKTKIFSIALDHDYSEEEYARKVAQYIGAEFYPLVATPKDVIGALDTSFDEPLGDQAALPTLLLSKMAREHVKVVLTGEGADEIFAGYSNYPKRLKQLALYNKLRFLFWEKWYRFLPRSLRKDRFIKAASRPLSRKYTTIPNLFCVETHSSLLSSALRQEVTLEDLAERHYFECDSNEYLDHMLHIDQNLWLSSDLLTKVDRATMNYSLEARVPYLDHRLVEFAARLPISFKLHKNVGKYLLKQVAKKGWIPSEIIERPKRGFVLPLHEWMQGDLKPLLDDALSSHGLMGRNIFKKDLMKSSHHATRLFALLSLELWFRKYAPNFRF
jgi:asparagine synthase (glutamine-hydrolysing)